MSGLLSSADAQATYATQQALTEGLADKVDGDALQYYETAQHAQATYATKAALDGKADAEEMATALAGKASTADIPDVSGFETSAHAQATYATQQALTDGLAGKADASAIPDVSGFITSAAIAGMATQTWVQDYIAALDANNTGY